MKTEIRSEGDTPSHTTFRKVLYTYNTLRIVNLVIYSYVLVWVV